MLFSSSDCGRGAHVLRVRSAPRPRLSRLLPFALWQDTSLQAKKQCSRRTTKHNFGCAFSLSGCGQGAHVPLYVPLLVLAFLDLCALLRVWSTFGKRYGAAFRDFQRLLCARLSLCFKHAPLLVLVFLGFCRLLFGKSPLCKQKKQCSRRTTKHNFGCAFFFVRLCVCCSRTSCTFRALSSPSSTCAPCSAFGQRLARDTVPPFAIFNACSAPDYLFVSNTLRASFSSFSALAVCSLASHLFASKKAVFKTYNKSTAICRAF